MTLIERKDELLTENELAIILKLKPRTLRAWRLNKTSPPFVPIGKRSIRYRVKDVLNWLSKKSSCDEF